jgi:ribosomal protein S18 acetylase RimI-like enzyme
MDEDWIIRTKKNGDEVVAGKLIAEAFSETYAVLACRDRDMAAKIAESEMLYRGRRGNLFVASRENKIIGVIEIISMEIPHMYPHEALSIYIKHLGPDEGLRAVYILSLMTRFLNKDEAAISSLATAAEERQSGVARALIARGEDYSREIGKKHLTLWVAESNAPAIKLYESAGFTTANVTSSIQMRKYFGIEFWRQMTKYIDLRAEMPPSGSEENKVLHKMTSESPLL